MLGKMCHYLVLAVQHLVIPDWESNVRNLRVVNEDGKTFVLCSEAVAQHLNKSME